MQEKQLVTRKLSFPAATKIELTPTSLNIIRELTEEELDETWEFLGHADSGVMWWIGDLALYEEGHGIQQGKESEWYKEKSEQTGLAIQTLQHVKSVSKRLDPCIRMQELDWGKHQIIVDAFDVPSEQAEWLQKAADNKWTTRQLRDAIKDSKPMPELPAGKYRIIYADPPWEYDTPQHTFEEQETVLETHYPTMRTEKICALPVGELAWDDCVLFLWNTVPLIHDALCVIEAWGFKFKSEFIWDKIGHNVGYWVSVRHERLWICSRGSCLPDNKKLYDSVQAIERTVHSAKPTEFRNIIDDLYPPRGQRNDRVELFARGQLPPHWDSWGNEA